MKRLGFTQLHSDAGVFYHKRFNVVVIAYHLYHCASAAALLVSASEHKSSVLVSSALLSSQHFLCSGAETDRAVLSIFVTTSSSLYAASKLENSVNLSFGLTMDVSRFTITSDDHLLIESILISRKISLNGEL